MTNFAFTLNPATKSTTAVFLIHGLFESPYVYRELAALLYAQGFFARAMCLPGHGTRPEELLTVTAEIWYEAVKIEWQNLKSQFQKIIVIGHSTGGALALKLSLEQHIDGLILIAPAIEIKTPLAKLLNSTKIASAFEAYLPWLMRVEETDMARYHSIPFNAVHQVFRLSKELKKYRTRPFSCPTFLISTMEDETISHTAAVKDFLSHPSQHEKKALFFSGKNTFPAKNFYPELNIEYCFSAYPKFGILHQSHVGLLFSKENENYGISGTYFRASHPDPDTVLYGAYHHIDETWYRFLKRLNLVKQERKSLTFNPNFELMTHRILAFLKEAADQPAFE